MAGNKNSGGKNKKPLVLKKLQGSINTTREKDFNPPAATDLVNIGMPDHLELTESGRMIWDSLAADLTKIGILKLSDIQAFAIYCNEYARYLKMARFIQQHGEIYMDANNNPKKRPEINVMYESLRIVNTYQSRFGLTPADRDRITVEKEDDSNDFNNLLS